MVQVVRCSASGEAYAAGAKTAARACRHTRLMVSTGSPALLCSPTNSRPSGPIAPTWPRRPKPRPDTTKPRTSPRRGMTGASNGSRAQVVADRFDSPRTIESVQTPLWVPLLVAGIGVLGTLAGGIGGVLITQRRADRREYAAWQREHEQWQREDVARTFEHRREACVELFGSIRAARDEVRWTPRRPPADKEHVDEIGEALFKQFATLSPYASPELTAAAYAAIVALSNVSWEERSRGATSVPSSALKRLLAAEEKLVRLIRRELYVPTPPTSLVTP